MSKEPQRRIFPEPITSTLSIGLALLPIQDCSSRTFGPMMSRLMIFTTSCANNVKLNDYPTYEHCPLGYRWANLRQWGKRRIEELEHHLLGHYTAHA
jgi:hypothetical protein